MRSRPGNIQFGSFFMLLIRMCRVSGGFSFFEFYGNSNQPAVYFGQIQHTSRACLLSMIVIRLNCFIIPAAKYSNAWCRAHSMCPDCENGRSPLRPTVHIINSLICNRCRDCAVSGLKLDFGIDDWCWSLWCSVWGLFDNKKRGTLTGTP